MTSIITNTSSEPTNSSLEEQSHNSQESMTKCVTFNLLVKCRPTISRHDYSEKEALQSWLSDEEMEKMNKRQFKTVERMESGKGARRESTYRGLETMSAKGQAELDGIIQYCVGSVLDEQDRQFYLFDEIHDDEMIALASSNCSEECTQKALNRARSDAREAKRCYRRMRDMDADDMHNSDHSNSSFSASDEQRPTIPILKTGGNLQQQTGDSRDAALQPLEPLEDIVY
mmetsp:Transcript_26129/g.63721  ORF Transcript_26129/g.63721 Transcript_26129/m.63721 type:complete len:229 (-) Transcript_26129:335-1021(-)|eukprot:CAMPEP_0113619228 /NCGR_PEP_ID=MMETSP0017_2-20120614/9758_1 /TAXON_ID=2856 /ORGANISM="Cylindrotheca closterium" /LENGTH=228 /DNA_ID=CAMNT_0000528789 /DNA_START=50 /DNA_END=736 /DNA_ORIENTATION=+ /assembly_acc=CAM_ASM_000147